MRSINQIGKVFNIFKIPLIYSSNFDWRFVNFTAAINMKSIIATLSSNQLFDKVIIMNNTFTFLLCNNTLDRYLNQI